MQTLSEEELLLKICMKDTLDSKGSITIAAAIILSCIILFNLVLYDFVKLKTTISCIPHRISLACNSVLASYDSLLADKYGIYGYNTASGSSVHKDFLFYYGDVECDVRLKDDFTKPEIIKEQICDIMKIKTPTNVIESVLEAFDIISESDKSCDEHSVCGKAAQKLSELQRVHDELCLKVEGYFSGDSMCVNGFSQGVAVEIASSIIKADEASFEKIICQVISLHKQYKGFNEEAVVLYNELRTGVDEIYSILSKLDISKEDSSEVDNSASIKEQAQTLLNTAAYNKIAHNCNVFEDRIALLEDIKEKKYANINQIKSVISKGKIYTDIRINTLHIGDSQGFTDKRNDLTDDIKNKVQNNVFYDDLYEIPAMDYAMLPSVKAVTLSDSYQQIINPGADGFMDNFGSFDGMFSFWDDISFESILEDITDTILVDDYIITYMTTRLSGVSDDKLNNEIEYIIGGSASCDENNDVVEQKIVALRFVLNFANIMQDKEKTSIAEAMAAAIAAVVSRGAGVTLYKYIIISAWAIIDSYIDVEKLLKGESVPLIEFGDVEKINEIQDYDFYLRLLLLMTDKKTKLLRICDMIEINMKEITGENYRLSGVYNTVYAKVITEFDFISRDLLGIKNKFKREDFYEVSY